MKSLKRTLCLVLALVMVLGLFGIASATNFTDDNTIQYKEAVEVVTGIGAITGYDNGTFNPKGTITRAEAAVMVTRVALTAGVAADLTGINSSFTDVTVDGGFKWAIPSIEYMVKENIINGRGDGTFDPNGQINGYAVLKMLLCVLGYGKQSEYIGDQWTLQVAIDANTNKLTTGKPKDVSLSNPATREEVALYCYNALGVEKVQYSALDNLYKPVKEGTSAYNGAANKTLADLVYGIDTIEGVVTVNQGIKADAKATAFETNRAATAVKYSDAVTGADLVGHYVKVYYNAANTTKTGATEATAFETYAVTDLSTVVSAPLGISGAKKWAEAFGSADVVKDNMMTFAANTYATSGASISVTDGTSASAGTYIVYDGKIVSAIENPTFQIGYVSEYTAPTATTTGRIRVTNNNASVADVIVPKTGDTTSDTAKAYATYKIYDGIAKDDVVTYATVGGANGFKTISATSKVTGAVSAYTAAVPTTGTPATYNVGGTVLPISPAYTGANGVATGFTAGDNATATLVNDGKTYDVYLNAQGMIVAMKAVDGTTDAGVVLVVRKYTELASTSYGASVYLVKAQCVDMNGKEVIYTIGVQNKDGTAADGASLITDSTAFGYNVKVNNDNGKGLALADAKICKVTTAHNDTYDIDIAKLDDSAIDTAKEKMPAGAASTAIAKDALTFGAAANKLFFTPNTKFVFIGHDNTNVYAGTQLKVGAFTGVQAVTSAATTYVSVYATAADTLGNFEVQCVFVTEARTASTADGLIFVPAASAGLKNVQASPDGKGQVAINTAYLDGKPTQIMTKLQSNGQLDTELAKADSANKFFTYSVDSNGIYTLKENSDNVIDVAENVTAVYGNKLTTATKTTYYTLADNAYIVDVGYDAASEAAKPSLVPLTSLDKLLLKKVVYVFDDTTKTISGIYVVPQIVITAQPTATQEVDKTSGADVTLTVSAYATNGATLTYQWKSGTTGSVDTNVTDADGSIAGATTSSLVLTATKTEKVYQCTITTSPAGLTATSAEAAITLSA